MKKLLLTLLALAAITALVFAGRQYWFYEENPNLIRNPGFEEQVIPEGVLIETNRIPGWHIKGPVYLWREQGNTVVAVPYGSSVWADIKGGVWGEAYSISFVSAVKEGNQTIQPWTIRQHLEKKLKQEGRVKVTSERPGAVWYVDNFAVIRFDVLIRGKGAADWLDQMNTTIK